ncbi:heme-dependent oxidative N-demethylase family protein [Pseudaestuariivita atlantica]|uniref:DUF3445 domain-containing protein n=1 Tax=Pseudaestuariivita atlantica TaxID=1317121 RepID=A0A0L1JUH3_9RHOB|nr:DUF3445 domain-containing protein [Pseudaestuariivita atlantica]KNG95416.1 hypothetical protein ATO11_02085 [Pseudaestuariivita atlantica]
MAILQTSVPYPVDPHARLPGIGPTQDWLHRDEAYAAQMAERVRLLRDRRDEVHALLPEGRAAAEELLEAILAEVSGWPGFEVSSDRVACPDGRGVAIDRSDPLGTAARIVQEDLCLMEEGPDGHVMTGAVLCFPASWMLSEKIGRPLSGIHDPVEEYDGTLERRVQRLFDAIRPGTILMRHNALWYHDPALFQPRSIHARRDKPDYGHGDYLRTERQTLRRLPRTGAVVFAIHTFILHREDGERALSVSSE